MVPPLDLSNSKLFELRRELVRRDWISLRKRSSVDYIKAFDFEIDTLVDVGVHEGTDYLYESFQSAKSVLVDPRPESLETIEQREFSFDFDYDFHVVALGSSEGEQELTIPETVPGKGRAMSSLKDRIDALKDTFTSEEKRKVKVTTLDNLLEKYPGRIGLKIDTEGSELDILKGGVDTLKRCAFVILELSLIRRFSDTSPPSEIIKLLASNGLEFRDILEFSHTPPRKKDQRPRHIDALFVPWHK